MVLENCDDSLRGRVVKLSLGDLNNGSEDQAHRMFRLRVDEIQGKSLLTNFHGMDFTSDKLKSMVKKWQTLIEAHIDVKTSDGYLLRFFSIGFTKRRPNQVTKTSYAQKSHVRAIRKKMFDIIAKEVSPCELKDVVNKLIPDTIGKEIEKQCQSIYPLQNVCIRKVKILKMPKLDVSKLLELHAEGGATEELGTKVDRPQEWTEPEVLTSV